MSKVVDNLLHPRNANAWRCSKPYGIEGDNLMKFLRDFHDLVAFSIIYHLTFDDISADSAIVSIKHSRIGKSLTLLVFSIFLCFSKEDIFAPANIVFVFCSFQAFCSTKFLL